MKLKKALFGVRAGKIYPEWIEAGEDCPEELMEAAVELDALEDARAPEAKAKGGAPENKAQG